MNFFKDIRVAHIIDDCQLVLNVGSKSNAGVEINDRFLIYGLSENEIIDPITGGSLGYLELVRGTGIVTYIQDYMCILTSDTDSPILKLATTLSPNAYIPFKNPMVGDFARRLQK